LPGQQPARSVASRSTPPWCNSNRPPPGTSQAWLNLVAALKNANPAYAALTGSDRPVQDVPATERAMKMLGPFGVKYSAPKSKGLKK
jgi:hypothetical protein